MENNEKQTPFLKRVAKIENRLDFLEKRIETIVASLRGRK